MAACRLDNLREAYKPSGSNVFAHTSVFPRLGNRRGDNRRLAVLRALASSTLPLTAREIASRAGMPLRSAQYYLRQLVGAGLVERRGKRTTAVYALTRRGAVELQFRSSLLRKNCASSRVGALQPDGVICNGNGVRGSPCVARASLEYQPMGGWWGEVGLRCRWRPFRRVLEAVAGLRLPKRRVKRIMFYVRDGVVHFDGVVAAGAEEAELFGLWLLKERVVALVLLCFSIMKWMGFEKRFVDALWSAAPALAVR